MDAFAGKSATKNLIAKLTSQRVPFHSIDDPVCRVSLIWLKKKFQSGLPRPSYSFARIMFANLHRKTGGKLRIPSHRGHNDRFFEFIILTPSELIDNETVILSLESKNGGIFKHFRVHREELYSYIELRFLLRTSKMSDLKSNVINSLSPNDRVVFNANFTVSSAFRFIDFSEGT